MESLILRIYLKIYNNSKDSDDNKKKNYDFEVFNFFGLDGAEKEKNVILINEF